MPGTAQQPQDSSMAGFLLHVYYECPIQFNLVFYSGVLVVLLWTGLGKLLRSKFTLPSYVYHQGNTFLCTNHLWTPQSVENEVLFWAWVSLIHLPTDTFWDALGVLEAAVFLHQPWQHFFSYLRLPEETSRSESSKCWAMALYGYSLHLKYY